MINKDLGKCYSKITTDILNAWSKIAKKNKANSLFEHRVALNEFCQINNVYMPTVENYLDRQGNLRPKQRRAYNELLSGDCCK